MTRRRSLSVLMPVLGVLFFAWSPASPASGGGPLHSSVGPGQGTDLPGTRDTTGDGDLFTNYDGSAEDGYCWSYEGVVPPYYGAFAECFSIDGLVTGIQLKLTGLGYEYGPLDAYVWADDGGLPGSVLSVTTGLLPPSVPRWPQVGTNDLGIQYTQVDGAFWLGFCAGAPSYSCGYFIAADLDGPDAGCPVTNIAPGIGYPTGWHDVDIAWGPTQALGIGAWFYGGVQMGACCLPDLTCAHMLNPSQCAAESGEWMGYEVPCQPTPCGQSPGACCYADGSCVFTCLANCPSGDWQPDTPCETADCGQTALGACCIGSECILVTEEGCPGRWLGVSESCYQNPCPPGPPDSTYCVDYGAYLHAMGGIDAGSAVSGVAVAGGLAYVLVRGAGLMVVDITNPWVPRVLGSVPVPDQGTAVTVADACAYVTTAGYDGWRCTRGSLTVIDLADAHDPRVVASSPCGNCAYRVAVKNQRAYVATWYDDGTGRGGLMVFDVSNPPSPQFLGGLETETWIEDVAVDGAYAYAVGDGGLEVIDVSDPLQLRSVGNAGTRGDAIAIAGARAYVASPGLQVIDITDPEDPWVMGSAPVASGYPAGVAVSGSHAFVVGSGLRVVDVSDPSHLEVVGGLCGSAGRVAIAGDRAYLAGGYRLDVADISNPLSPVLLGAAPTPDHALGVVVSGANAYVAAGTSGLQIMDISDTGSPVIVGSVAIPGEATAVALSDDRAYVGSSECLEVVDVTDPRNPRSVGRLTGLDPVFGLAVLGQHVCVVDDADWWDEAGHLRVIDVTEASHPILVGSVPLAGGASAIALSESGPFIHAYLAVVDLESRRSLLQVADVTYPEGPHIVGTSPMTESGVPRGVAVVGSYAYLSGAGFDVLDVADPRSPRIVASLDVSHSTYGMALSGLHAYAANGNFLFVVDVSVPRHPWLVGSALFGEGGFADLPGNIVAAGDSVVYVAAPEGLRILPTRCEAEEPSGWAEAWVPAAGLRLSASPKPASRATTLQLTLPALDRVRVTLHDVAGRQVRGLYDGSLDAGPQTLVWDGTDDGGRAVPAGIYLARASTSRGMITARVVILR